MIPKCLVDLFILHVLYICTIVQCYVATYMYIHYILHYVRPYVHSIVKTFFYKLDKKNTDTLNPVVDGRKTFFEP